MYTKFEFCFRDKASVLCFPKQRQNTEKPSWHKCLFWNEIHIAARKPVFWTNCGVYFNELQFLLSSMTLGHFLYLQTRSVIFFFFSRLDACTVAFVVAVTKLCERRLWKVFIWNITRVNLIMVMLTATLKRKAHLIKQHPEGTKLDISGFHYISKPDVRFRRYDFHNKEIFWAF